MISTLKEALTNQVADDIREPIFTFNIHGHTLGILLPSLHYYVQLFVAHTIGQIFTIFMAAIVYYIIIRQRDSGRRFISYFVGLGIVIPIYILWYPFAITEYLQIQNMFIRFFTFTTLPVVMTFHTIEAIYGFSPKNVESSFTSYLLYSVVLLELECDDKTHKPVQIKRADIFLGIKNLIHQTILISTIVSLFSGCNYQPYKTSVNANIHGFNLLDAIDFNLFRNNIISTVFLVSSLSWHNALLNISVMLMFRVKTRDVMLNPLLASTSPSDFWGRKWNLLIHNTLKRGVFKPVMSHTNSKAIAIFATFLASAWFHEWTTTGRYLSHLHYFDITGSESHPRIGLQTAFFLWNGVLVTIEYLFGHARIFKVLKANLPACIISALVVSTAMPLGHWFLHPYSKVVFFEHSMVALPVIVQVSQ